jgi:nucleotide-binding universal stress UspA family protein
LRPAEAEEQRALDASVSGWSGKYPGVRIATRLMVGDTGRSLADASAGARLIVVGSRGRAGLSGLVPGSISQYLLRHAGCPVAVVPTDRARR